MLFRSVAAAVPETFYTTEPLSYNTQNQLEQKWLSVSGTYSNGKVEVTVPEDASVYYISICTKTASGNFYSSSRLVSAPLDDYYQGGDSSVLLLSMAGAAGLTAASSVLIRKRRKYN